jgi:hypothetical protein
VRQWRPGAGGKQGKKQGEKQGLDAQFHGMTPVGTAMKETGARYAPRTQKRARSFDVTGSALPSQAQQHPELMSHS